MEKSQIIHIVAEATIVGGLTVYLLNENSRMKSEIEQLKKDLQVVAQKQALVQQTHANAISSVMKSSRGGAATGHHQPQPAHSNQQPQPKMTRMHAPQPSHAGHSHSSHSSHTNHPAAHTGAANHRPRPQAGNPHAGPGGRRVQFDERVQVLEDEQEEEFSDDDLLASEFGDDPELDDEYGEEEQYEEDEPEPEQPKLSSGKKGKGKKGGMKIPSSAPKNRAGSMEDVKARAAMLARQAEEDDE